MSHIATIELEINDLAALKEACRDLGFEFIEGQTTYRWFATKIAELYGQDKANEYVQKLKEEQRADRPIKSYTLAEGTTIDDMGKCHHAIKVPGADYEIGVVQLPNERYVLHADYWNAGGLEARVGKGCVKLRQAYTVCRIKHEARRKGKTVKVERLEDRIRVTVN